MKQSREQEMEKRFEMVMRIVKRHNGDEIPDIETKAQKLYLADNKDLNSVYNEIETSTAQALADNSKSVTKQSNKKSEGSFHGGAFKPIEKYIDLDGVGKGHYIVANVFKNETYLKTL